MECSLRQNRLAGEQRLGYLFSNTDGPFVEIVRPICESDQKTSVGNAFHQAEKPFRRERFFGPRTAPANRMNGRPPPVDLAFSNCSRTIFPWATPERLAVSSNHAASSLLRRIVIV